MTKVAYTKELLQEAANVSFSIMGVLDYLGLAKAGGNHSHIKRRLEHFGIDTSHFTGQGHGKGKKAPNRKSHSEILVVLPSGSVRPKASQLRRALKEHGREEACEECGLSDTWNDKPLRLEVDHVDRNWLNNLAENLRFLCPNCHSQF